jgi:hypothetical protein
MPGGALCFDSPGLLDRSAEKEQLFRQCGFTGIGMTDDAEGSSAVNFFLIVTFHKLS